MNLTVKELATQDCWRDIVRVKKMYRADRTGKPIKRGRVCLIGVGSRSTWVVLHGRHGDEPVIQMDLNTRLSLDVKVDETYDIEMTQLPWFRSLWYPWFASDPGYRIPGQLSLISLLLGVLGFVLGLVATWLGILSLRH